MTAIATMLDLFSQPMLTAFKGCPVDTNNVVAKLHYKVTTSTLVILGFLVTSAVHFGQAISCIQNPELVPAEVLHTFCWIQPTFNLPNTEEVKDIAEDLSAFTGTSGRGGSSPIFYSYYQWVCLMLILQSFFFYLPRYLWRVYQGGFFTYLLAARDDPAILTKYFIAHRGTHRSIAAAFHSTEFLFSLNLLCQIVLTDVFLAGQFLPLGITVFVKPAHLLQVFPRLTKCTFRLYGPSGDVQRQDALCVLGQNVFNEKIFLFLWFWYAFLFLASLTVTMWRLASLCVPSLRTLRLRAFFDGTDRRKLDRICEHLSFSDWFVLVTVSKNLSPLSCRQLYQTLYAEMPDAQEKHYSFEGNGHRPNSPVSGTLTPIASHS